MYCSPDSSESESDDPSEESESEEEVFQHGSRETALGIEDANDDEDAPTQGPAAYTKTLNEVVEDDVVIPEISEVDAHEPLEKVGDILSILNNKIVVVKGVASQIAERVLDSDTLLVFEDRKVMGFVSTFTSVVIYLQLSFCRSTRLLDRHISLSTKSVSTTNFPWTSSERKPPDRYFTCRVAANLFSSAN